MIPPPPSPVQIQKTALTGGIITTEIFETGLASAHFIEIPQQGYDCIPLSFAVLSLQMTVSPPTPTSRIVQRHDACLLIKSLSASESSFHTQRGSETKCQENQEETETKNRTVFVMLATS